MHQYHDGEGGSAWYAIGMAREFSEAQAKAAAKYQKEHTAIVSIRMPKEKKEAYLRQAEEEGKSLSRFIMDTMDDYLAESIRKQLDEE